MATAVLEHNTETFSTDGSASIYDHGNFSSQYSADENSRRKTPGQGSLIVENIVARDCPQLTSRCSEILEKLLSSYCDQDLSILTPSKRTQVEEQIRLLSDPSAPPFTIQVIDSEIKNAMIWTEGRQIFINKGLIRSVSEKSGAWDEVSFFIAHEISHILYGKIQHSSTSRTTKSGRALDMEFTCDKFALELMDVAGFSVKFGTFRSIEEQLSAMKQTNLGIFSSHPHLQTRELENRNNINSRQWISYSEDPSFVFTEAEIREAKSHSDAWHLGTVKKRESVDTAIFKKYGLRKARRRSQFSKR